MAAGDTAALVPLHAHATVCSPLRDAAHDARRGKLVLHTSAPLTSVQWQQCARPVAHHAAWATRVRGYELTDGSVGDAASGCMRMPSGVRRTRERGGAGVGSAGVFSGAALLALTEPRFCCSSLRRRGCWPPSGVVRALRLPPGSSALEHEFIFACGSAQPETEPRRQPLLEKGARVGRPMQPHASIRQRSWSESAAALSHALIPPTHCATLNGYTDTATRVYNIQLNSQAAELAVSSRGLALTSRLFGLSGDRAGPLLTPPPRTPSPMLLLLLLLLTPVGGESMSRGRLFFSSCATSPPLATQTATHGDAQRINCHVSTRLPLALRRRGCRMRGHLWQPQSATRIPQHTLFR
jgi:hypothetical protein